MCIFFYNVLHLGDEQINGTSAVQPPGTKLLHYHVSDEKGYFDKVIYGNLCIYKDIGFNIVIYYTNEPSLVFEILRNLPIYKQSQVFGLFIMTY